jgi:signal transduction histidine kinase
MRRTLAADSALAAALLGLTLAILAARGFGTPDPRSRTLDLPGVLLAAGSVLPVLCWRRLPLTAYLGCLGATLALVALRYPLDIPVGALAAAYLVALSYSGAGPARRRTAQLAVAAATPLLVGAVAASGHSVALVLPEVTILALEFAGAWVVADRSRLRRERVAEAEERAVRAEREAEREARLAAAEERTRIARELHDSAGHAITVILVQAGAARLLHARDPERSLRAIGTIEDVARDTVGEIDRLVRALREDEAPPAGGPDVDALLDQHRAAGLRVTGSVPAPPRELPASVAWAAYRILQEALTNAARHGTGSARVELRYRPEAVELLVTNPVPAGGRPRPAGGHGIVGMRERATLLGGEFTAGRAGPEFRLRARLPYAEALVS